MNFETYVFVKYDHLSLYCEGCNRMLMYEETREHAQIQRAENRSVEQFELKWAPSGPGWVFASFFQLKLLLNFTFTASMSHFNSVRETYSIFIMKIIHNNL